MKKYLSIFRIRFANTLQYRSAALAGLATQFVWGFMEILAFMAFYKGNPKAFPMSLSQTVTYLWLQQAFLALFMVWFYEREILEAISTGNIAYELARPLHLYHRWFFQSIANRSAKAFLRCFPVLIVAFFLPPPFNLALPPSVGHFLLFLLSMVLALGVVVAFSMLVYISTFYTISSMGIRILTASIVDFLSGAIIPLPFFPENLQKVITFLPFYSMQNAPLRIYSGHIAGVEAYHSLLLQGFWLVALIFLGQWFMKNALTKVVVQGG